MHLGVGEVHDGPLVSFLLQRALLERRKEEELEVLQRKRHELVALLDVPRERRTPDQHSRVQALTREVYASKRKRKKRRKRRLPLLSPRLVVDSDSCICRAGFPGSVLTRCLLRFFGRPKLPGIIDGMDKMDCIHRAPAVVSGSGVCRCGFASFVPRAVFLHVVMRPKMLRIMAVWLRSTVSQLVFVSILAGFARDAAPRAVFLCFSALQADGFWPFWPKRFRPRSSPTTVVCSWLVLLVTMYFALRSLVVVRLQMLAIMAGLDQQEQFVAPCRKLRIFLQFLLIFQVVDFPVVVQRPTPMVLTVQADHRNSPVALGQGGRCPCYAGLAASPCRSHPCRGAETVSHGLSDHVEIPQLHVDKVFDVPVCRW